MTQVIAEKTLKLIDSSIENDQGNSYRGYLKQVVPHMDDAYRKEDSPFRTHLGASILGAKCTRSIWYSFRWTDSEQFSGRILRLFNRGHLEEARFVAILLSAGIQVYQQDADGNQFRISEYGGHLGGSGDGIAIGLPDLSPEEPALIECKTSAENAFNQLKKKGVRVSKFEHYVQQQLYLKYMGLRNSLYLVVNKNTDELYGEIVTLDLPVANSHVERAGKIISSREAPPRISNKSTWFECKFCTFHAVCHRSKVPNRNCRTCVFSTPHTDGKWYCTLPEIAAELDKDAQMRGCDNHRRLF